MVKSARPQAEPSTVEPSTGEPQPAALQAAMPVMPGTQRFVITGAARALGITALYLGRSVLMPLAFAALLAFVLDPVVTALRRWHVPHALAVGLVMTLTMAALGGGAVLLGQQVVVLSQDLPTYQSTIRKKLRDLRPDAASSHILSDASRVIGMVEGELNAVREEAAGGAGGASGSGNAGSKARAPTKVLVEPAPPSPLRAILDFVTPVVLPLVTAGLVAVLAVFLLLQRHEMRDRLVRLTGGDLHHMADAMNEAAHRVSRYLGAQLLINVGYGIPMALGLWLIGVPGALLWGFLSGVLRFVPYLGPAVAALFPLLLAFAIDPGWQMMVWTLALIVSMELIINNIVEPLAYGGRTGVSPVAVLLSAGFWALLWGPVGLVLATPLTVCLLALGRYLAPLRFLEPLLGNEPVFDKPTQLYQRFISGELEEAIELSHQEVARSSLLQYYSNTAVPMLALAATPSSRRATAEQRHRVVNGVSRLLDDLRASHPALVAAQAQGAPACNVLCIGARNEVDTLSAEMLAHALSSAGCTARAVPALAVTADRIDGLELDGIDTVCLCTFSGTPQTHTRFVRRRLHRLQRPGPALRVVLAAWSAPPELLQAGADAELGLDAVAVSLLEAQGRVMSVPTQPATGAPQLTVDSSAGEPVPSAGPEERFALCTPTVGVAVGVGVGAAAGVAAGAGVAVAVGAAAAATDSVLLGLRDTLARGAQQAAEVFSAPLASASYHSAALGPLQCSAGLPDWAQRAGSAWRAEASLMAHLQAHFEADGQVGHQSLVVPDIARDPGFAGKLGDSLEGLSFLAAAGLWDADGAIVGVLAIHDTQARPFTDGDRQLLADMAAELCASAAVETARSPGNSSPAV